MNNLDRQYQSLLQDILDNGVEKQDRTGTGTISVFGRQIRHKMSEGFPLLTTKKMPFKTITTELLWFLRGDTNIKYLVDNGCHIWDGDAFKNFMTKSEGDPDMIWNQEQFIHLIKTDDEFAKRWGDLGPIYGKQWRSLKKPSGVGYSGSITLDKTRTNSDAKIAYDTIDQIQNLINELKTNPDSRRLMVNAWNVGELDQMVLPPCHYGFQVYTRPTTREEKIVNPGKYRAISLMWNQRSVDTFLGLPFNIASYGLLLEIIAKEVNMVPDELIGNLGDVHLYSNHIEQAREQIGRELTWEEKIQWVMKNTDVEMENLYITEAAAALEATTRQPYPLPNLIINDEFWNPDAGIFDQINHIEVNDFMIDNYQSHPPIKAPLSN